MIYQHYLVPSRINFLISLLTTIQNELIITKYDFNNNCLDNVIKIKLEMKVYRVGMVSIGCRLRDGQTATKKS